LYGLFQRKPPSVSARSGGIATRASPRCSPFAYRTSLVKALVTFVCERLSLAVVGICTIFMVLVFTSVEINATRIGTYGIVFRGDTNTVDLVYGSVQGALRTGDRIDLASLMPKERFSLQNMAAPANAQMTVRVIRNHRAFPVTLSATPPAYTRRTQLTRDIGIPLCFFLSFGLASALFLMRPRPVTLAFYAYAILMLIKVYQTPLDLAAWPMNLASDLAIQVVYPATQVMILIVAQRLYGKPGRAWRWFLWSAVAVSLAVFLIWLDPIVWLTFQKWALPGPTRILEDLADVLLLVIVLCGLSYIASGVEGEERRRVTWIAAGIALSPLLDLTWAISDIVSALIRDSSPVLLALEDWTDTLLPWFGLLGIVAVLYGFLSRRVVDIRVVIGRAAIYGAMTLVLVIFFGIVEWLAEQVFEDTRPAIYVSLVSALIIGFAMNALHERAKRLFSNFFFREQQNIEQRLQRAARALANTSSEHTLIEFLIDEPVRALGLVSSALFLAQANGAFERVAARGWTRDEPEEIEGDDPLIVQMRTELKLVRLDAWRPAGAPLPLGTKAPALAVPLVMRGSVFGFVFYGERENGIPLDSSEAALLEAIATSAAAAYDHIDAERSRARIATLEARLQEGGVAPP
jgi:hypothetical protein